ncbi:elongation factor G [SAR202 cluster bacterium AC-647-N09_OGT_505m]|nr:elongation factor G [SAR202 cluster bacterium AC-647-N09_OGT_505m]
MQNLTVDLLRNIALLSHGGAGKSCLAEALLLSTGAITRMGRIEDGNTTSDYEPEEVKRGSSTQMSLIPCLWNNHKINFIDTPGYADFIGEVVAALRVADGGVVVVAAPSGIEVGTEQMWDMLDKQLAPRIVFVNKMDRENADFMRTVDALQVRFGRACIATHLPIGTEANFKGVINLLSTDQDYPQEMAREIETARERLTEAVAESDDNLATKYLEGETITEEELKESLRRGVVSGQIVPVLPGSATSSIGIQELLEVVIDYMPSPDIAGNQQEESFQPEPADTLAALVFKTSADPYVGKISYFRVYDGTLKSDSQIWNSDKDQAERVGQLFIFRGKNQEQIPQVIAGDIGAVTKLSVTTSGDTLCQRENPLTLPAISFPAAHHNVAVYPKSKQDVDKMSASLARIAEEDPSLKVYRETDTGEVLLAGLGDVHVEVTEERIKRKFGIDLILQTPKVAYKETITAPAKVEYKHKKQSGGHGQYGHVFLELQPLPKSTGFEFGSKVVGGNVPREYFPAVEKGIVKSLDEGTVAGYPVVDIKVLLYDGSFHPVDSSGMSFEIAGGFAFRKGLGLAQPVLLEPIMRAEVRVPDSFTGEVTGDLNTKRARILGMTPQDGYTTIDVEVPQAEMLRYSTDLRSLTQGKGSFFQEFDHYEAVPAHLTQKIAEDAKDTAS